MWGTRIPGPATLRYIGNEMCAGRAGADQGGQGEDLGKLSNQERRSWLIDHGQYLESRH